MPVPFDSDRRRFVVSSAAAAGSLLLGFQLAGRQASAAPADGFRPNAFVRIDAQGITTVLVPNTEIGQGSLTALAMIVAEELDARWDHVRAEQAPAAPAYAHPWFGVQMTGASAGTGPRWDPLRNAGATARAMLVAAAASRWGVDPAACRTEPGRVLGPGGQSLDYGALVAEATTVALPAQVRLKQPEEYRLVGRDLPRLDTPDKVKGTAVFGIDVQLPGLLTAVVERSPVIGGKLTLFDPARALSVPGVKHVAPVAGGVAVIAEGFWAAQKGREQLQVIWNDGPLAAFSTQALSATHRELAQGSGIEARREGDVASAAAGRRVEATYEVPYLAHACMEPMTCTAWVRPEGVELWAPTQAQGINQVVLARVLGIKPEQVTIHTTFAGGGFGRRAAQDFVIDAVLASKAAGGPVKLIYTREDDTRALYYRPAALGRMSAVLDQNGDPLALSGRVVCSSAYGGAGYDVVFKGPLDPGSVEGMADLPYAVPNLYVDWVRHEPGVQVFTWRSVGQSFVIFFVESFIDELAHAALADPVQYRLRLLAGKPKVRRVLELAAEKARWGTPLPAGHARGVALCQDMGRPMAMVVEASVSDGTLSVHRVVSVVDCGLAINPKLVRAQIEGSVIYGLSAALTGEITIRDGKVQQGNFHDYPVLRIGETPQLEVHLIDSRDPPGGVGEIAVAPVAPALCNAIFAATGKRDRTLPLRGQPATA